MFYVTYLKKRIILNIILSGWIFMSSKEFQVWGVNTVDQRRIEPSLLLRCILGFPWLSVCPNSLKSMIVMVFDRVVVSVSKQPQKYDRNGIR
jgi:hypothetical protein